MDESYCISLLRSLIHYIKEQYTYTAQNYTKGKVGVTDVKDTPIRHGFPRFSPVLDISVLYQGVYDDFVHDARTS